MGNYTVVHGRHKVQEVIYLVILVLKKNHHTFNVTFLKTHFEL